MVMYQYKTLKFVLNSSGLRSAWAARQHLYWRLKQEVCAPHVLQPATETEWTSIFYSWAAFNMLGPWNSSAAASCGALTSAPPGPGPSELNVQGEVDRIFLDKITVKVQQDCVYTANMNSWTNQKAPLSHGGSDRNMSEPTRLSGNWQMWADNSQHSDRNVYMTSGHFSCFFFQSQELKQDASVELRAAEVLKIRQIRPITD